MIENETPRTRSLLRQAARNVEAGKLVAAEQLYRQIIDENPGSAAAWLGLAEVTQDRSQKEAAYQQVLALDESNDQARSGLANLRGETAAPVAESGQAGNYEPDIVQQNTAESAAQPTYAEGEQAALEVAAPKTKNKKPESMDREFSAHVGEVHVAGETSDLDLFCYRHPNRSTSLRCYKCNKPICSECTVKTPVGYLCPDCYREAEDIFYNAKPTDYLLALLVALPLSLLAGWLAVRFSGGFFMILLFIFAGGAVGGFIARLSKRVMGNRRGRYIPHLVAACVVIGVLFWGWPWLLALFAGNAGVLLRLAGIGVYLFTATSSAFYWAR